MSLSAREEEEFVAFFLEERTPLLRAVNLWTAKSYMAEDIVHEAMMIVRESWDRYDNRWLLYTSARRIMVRQLSPRKSKGIKVHITYLDDEFANPGEANIQNQVSMTADEIIDNVMVVDALKRLPERQREVLTWSVICDLSFDMISKMLGITVSAVKTHQQRGLSTLREILSETTSQSPETATVADRKQGDTNVEQSDKSGNTTAGRGPRQSVKGA